MRLVYPFILLSFLVFGCAPKEQVVFRSLRNIKVMPSQGANLTLKAEAVFYNPNKLQMLLKEIDIEVFVDGKKSATAKQKLRSQIKAQSEFTVPLEVQLSLKELGLLDTILNLFGGKKFEIHYRGYIKVSVHGLRIRVPVDEKDEIKFKI